MHATDTKELSLFGNIQAFYPVIHSIIRRIYTTEPITLDQTFTDPLVIFTLFYNNKKLVKLQDSKHNVMFSKEF